MRFTIVTLFPEFFESPLAAGLMSKASQAGIVEFRTVNPRDFALDRHRTVDDRPYGGGPGMVMGLETLCAALESIGNPGRILLMTPRGRVFDQAMARELAGNPRQDRLGAQDREMDDEPSGKPDNITLICGRYEGVDARLEEYFPIEPVCVGDFVLNGGEAGALCVLEAVSRLLPDFMGHEDSGEEESFSRGLLEYPHYTRPEKFRDLDAPEILLSGDHARIAEWRKKKSLETTLRLRPDLLPEADLEPGDAECLRSLARQRLGRNLHLALVHYPVLNKFGEVSAVSLTNLDIHDMSRVSRSYALGGFFVVTPLVDQQELARDLTRHWVKGAGSRSNPDRAEALGMVRVAASLEDAVEEVRKSVGQPPRIVATSAREVGGKDGKNQALTVGAVRNQLKDHPVLLVFGTASGLAPEVLDMVHGTLRPIRFMDRYNHLPVRSAVAVTVDRLLGDVF